MARRKAAWEIKFECSVCGKPQPKDDSRSSANWNVYDVGVKCPCGGDFGMVLYEADGTRTVVGNKPAEPVSD